MEQPLKTLQIDLLMDDRGLQSTIAIGISLFVAHSPTLPLLFSGFQWVFSDWYLKINMKKKNSLKWNYNEN